MSEILSEISLDRFSPFPLSIDKNHLIANDFYLLTTPGCNHTQNYTDLILKGRQVYWKTGRLQTKRKFNPGFQEKIRCLIFFKDYF